MKKWKWLIIASSNCGILSVVVAGCLSYACVAKYKKQIQQKDKEIVLLKLKIADLEKQNQILLIEKEKLEQTITKLQEDLGIVTRQNNSFRDNSSRLMRSLLRKSREKSETIYITREQINFLAPSDQLHDSHPASEEEVIQILKNKHAEAVKNYETQKREIENSLAISQNNLKQETKNEYTKTIEALTKAIEELNKIKINSIDQGISFLDQKIEIDDALSSLNLNLNKMLLEELQEKQKTIAEKESEISSQFEKAKQMVQITIRASKEQVSYINSLKEKVSSFLNKDFSYTSSEVSENLKKEANSVLNYLGEYENELSKALEIAEREYETGVANHNINNFIVIDVDKFGKTNQNILNKTQILYDRDFNALFEKYKEINKLKENLQGELLLMKEELKNSKYELEELKIVLDNTNNAKEALLSELSANKEEFREILKDYILNVIQDLEKILEVIKTEDSKNISEIIKALEEQKEILTKTLEKYSEENFVTQYKDIINGSLELISQAFKEYNDQKLVPLQKEFIKISEELQKSKDELANLKDQINLKNSKIGELTEENTSYKASIETLEIEFSKAQEKLKILTNNLTEYKNKETNDLQESSSRILIIKEWYVKLKNQGNLLVYKIGDSTMTKELETILNETIELEYDNTSLQSVNNKINEYLDYQTKLSSLILQLQNKHYEETKSKQDAIIAENNTNILHLKEEVSDLTNTKRELETKNQVIENNKNELQKNISLKDQELAKLKEQKEENERQIKSLENVILQKDTKITELNERISKDQTDWLTRKIEAINKEKEELESNKAELEKANKELETKIQEKDDQILLKIKELAEARNKIEEKDNLLLQKNKEIENVSREKREIENSVWYIEKQKEVAEIRLRELENQVDNLEERLITIMSKQVNSRELIVKSYKSSIDKNMRILKEFYGSTTDDAHTYTGTNYKPNFAWSTFGGANNRFAWQNLDIQINNADFTWKVELVGLGNDNIIEINGFKYLKLSLSNVEIEYISLKDGVKLENNYLLFPISLFKSGNFNQRLLGQNIEYKSLSKYNQINNSSESKSIWNDGVFRLEYKFKDNTLYLYQIFKAQRITNVSLDSRGYLATLPDKNIEKSPFAIWDYYDKRPKQPLFEIIAASYIQTNSNEL
ncbi:coiled-coil domain-containing protein [Mycoplasmopsis glycophila]|uniref:Uncharacterized protein n=1 Tax=Mycoplasmopsis glycophila TaxID=171285 RepID=A0A449AV62_9BACT|nr:hypothetical protein [Mycoplasmopsis glycophila]VEU70385.1 Uncharacterised protein [Mycoplasmopsis glycophila]